MHFLLCLLIFMYVHSQSIELNEMQFDSFIKKHEYVLVLYYAPWCGHCKKLKPEFDKAADQQKNVAFAKLDCTEYPQVCQRFKVQAYPTLKFFVNGDPYDYTGGRTTEEILEWINRLIISSVQEISLETVLIEHINNNPAVIVHFNSTRSSVFQDVVRQYHNILPLYVKNEQLKQRYAPVHQVVFFLAHLKNPKYYPYDEIDTKSLNQFIENSLKVRVEEFSLTKSQTQKFAIFFYSLRKADRDVVVALNVFEEIAQSIPTSELNFFKANIDEEDNNLYSSMLHVELSIYSINNIIQDQLPQVQFIIQKDGVLKHSLLIKNLTKNSMKEFIQNHQSGLLEPMVYFRGNPQMLTPSNFYSIVTKQNKDVLVLFYVDKCVNCRKFLEILVWLNVFQTTRTLKVTKVDINEHNLLPDGTRKLPQLYLYPAESNNYEIYIGQPKKLDVIEFLLSHCKFKPSFLEEAI